MVSGMSKGTSRANGECQVGKGPGHLEQGIVVKQGLEQPRNKQADPSRWNRMLDITLVNRYYIMGSKEASVCCRLEEATQSRIWMIIG